jgi:hypothetical protein
MLITKDNATTDIVARGSITKIDVDNFGVSIRISRRKKDKLNALVIRMGLNEVRFLKRAIKGARTKLAFPTPAEKIALD